MQTSLRHHISNGDSFFLFFVFLHVQHLIFSYFEMVTAVSKLQTESWMFSLWDAAILDAPLHNFYSHYPLAVIKMAEHGVKMLW